MKKSKTCKMTGEQRRKQIKSVALELFAQKKYHSTTMAKVAVAAGVSEPLVYQHFKNKKELFLSVLSECYENILQETKQVLASKSDIKEVYTRLFRAYLQNMTKLRPARAKVFIMASGIDDNDIRTEVRTFDRNMTGLFAADLAEKAKKNNIHLSHSPDVIARIYFSLIIYRALLVLAEMAGDIDEIFNQSIDLLFSRVES